MKKRIWFQSKRGSTGEDLARKTALATTSRKTFFSKTSTNSQEKSILFRSDSCVKVDILKSFQTRRHQMKNCFSEERQQFC